MPDLLKNVDKRYAFKLERYEQKITQQPAFADITVGWKRHVEVDQVFHSAAYFAHHTHVLRKIIEDIIVDLPVRGTFLAHISFELLLDHRLITDKLVSVDNFYEKLEKVDRSILNSYLAQFELINIEQFNTFYDKFVESRYIKDYAKIDNLPYALFNICKRVWDFTPTTNHFESLAERINVYQQDHMQQYQLIYKEIEDCLN